MTGKTGSFAAALTTALLLVRCATYTVHPDAPRKVVGTEEGVRVEAEIGSEAIHAGFRVPITWSIENQRREPIAVADILPETTYDPESRVITVGLGAEVPGEQLLPRLVAIAPGETKTFSTSAILRYVPATDAAPNALRLRVNFLSDVKPFARLVGIQEKAVADAGFAAEIFPLWVERTEAVFTSAVPMRWGPAEVDPLSAVQPR